MLSTIAIFKEIYPKHVLLEIKLPQLAEQGEELSLNQVDLNQICIDPVKQWLQSIFNLTAKPTFPCWLDRHENFEFISKLVNGFVLQVGEHRTIFIPSDAIDLEEFEVPQEWVDLPNWAGSYYVPIRVDLEHQFLHLWGFISHQDLKDRATRDRIFRNYHIAQSEITTDLNLLQDDEYLPQISTQTNITPLERLSSTEAQDLIQQLHQRKSRLSPRLDLPFERWGAMLDDAGLLERYCHEDAETDLGAWWTSTKTTIWNGFELMGHFLNPPQAVPALGVDRVPSLHAIKGVDLGTDREINVAITKLYQQQTDLSIPEGAILHGRGFANGIDALIPLLKSCQAAKIWWTAAEYLWTVQPEHPFLITRIRQLETQFAGQSIALMVSMLPTLDDRTAVMVRLYPSGYGTYLPLGLQLTIQDDLGQNLLANSQGEPYIVTAGAEYACIHLYFSINPGERFVSCITLDDIKVLKPFKFNNYHHNQLLIH
jgi:Protein of unknown function (DUF1822)